jgi:hypothetical protein
MSAAANPVRAMQVVAMVRSFFITGRNLEM